MKTLLLFENVVVGEIADAFDHQGTQFGTFHCTLPPDGDDTSKRLRTFIEFCQDWFERCGSNAVADASEFDQYCDVVGLEKWTVQKPGAELTTIEDAPMFHDGFEGEISWLEKRRLPDG